MLLALFFHSLNIQIQQSAFLLFEKNDLKEAFWNERRNNKNQVISDEEADFKILSTNEKINAAILDNDSFFAGEKIYKWGDTLYLNE